MNTYIALLRGINVSGQKKVLMGDLRELLNNLSFKNVQTYIQSGNIVFQSKETNKSILESKISKLITDKYKFQVPILIKRREDLKNIVAHCPFKEDKKEKSYFTLLNSTPEQSLMDKLNNLNIDNETILVEKDCVYFFSNTGYGRAKCNNNFIERQLKVRATTRNYKTLNKLLEMTNMI